MVDTITLGTPTGSLRMPAVAIEVPPEPPMGKDTVKAAVSIQRRQKLFDAARHGFRGEGSVFLFGDGGHFDINRCCYFRVGNVRHGLRIEYAAVDGDGVDAQLFEAGFDVGEFFALGVKDAIIATVFM